MPGDIQFDHEAMSRARYRNMMTQQDLAEAAGLTVSTVNRIERGIQEPRLSTVKKIASALKVRPLDLMTARGPIEQEEANRGFAELEKN